MSKFDELMAMVPEGVATERQRFEPKLTFEQRCAALALFKVGFNRHVVSEVFGISPKTMAHMAADSSRYYKDVRDERRKLGHESFVAKYLEPAMVEKAVAVRNKQI